MAKQDALPAAAPQAAKPPADSPIPVASPSKKGTKKGLSANTLRQQGREYKAPAKKAAVEKAAPRSKRALTGSSSDALP